MGSRLGYTTGSAHIPAENMHIWQEWRCEDYVLIVEGEVRQSVLFGENLLLQRRIETSLGSRTLTKTWLQTRAVAQHPMPCSITAIWVSRSSAPAAC
jgi:hypothetical protein